VEREPPFGRRFRTLRPFEGKGRQKGKGCAYKSRRGGDPVKKGDIEEAERQHPDVIVCHP